jgi:hypothetical protein
MEKKKVAQGIDNFKELMDNNSYFVDKSLLIKDILDRDDKIILITRPRRFGKTMNMSMLKYFFEKPECRKANFEEVDTAYLFEDLKIWSAGDKYREHLGKYPLIFLTLKNAKQNNWNDTFENLKQTIAKEYKRHKYILNSDVLDENEKENYIQIMNSRARDIDYTNILFELSEYLKRYFRQDCMILIDEYDTPIQAGYLNGYFENVIEFMKSMLVKGFNDNNALKKGVLTGIMKVALESIFSDFNNPMIATVLTEEFSEFFGFTELEVEEMAEYLGFSSEMEDIKKWYNGYIFGLDTVIYNPWSIIRYLYNPRNGLKPYWVNTSDNRLIREIMQLDKAEGKRVIEALLKGEEVIKPLEDNIIYQSIKTRTDVAWTFLLHAGYLKVSDRRLEKNKLHYSIKIPNIEVKTVYEGMLLDYFTEDVKLAPEIEGIIGCLSNGDTERLQRFLYDFYFKNVSYYDVGNKMSTESEQEENHENFHHGFFLGLFTMIGADYIIDSNREYGLGRPDIVVIPKDVQKPAYVFEFKWESTRGSKTLEILCEDALSILK